MQDLSDDDATRALQEWRRSGETTLSTLPTEIILRVIKGLIQEGTEFKPEDLQALALTDHRMHDILSSNSEWIWRTFINTRFPLIRILSDETHLKETYYHLMRADRLLVFLTNAILKEDNIDGISDAERVKTYQYFRTQNNDSLTNCLSQVFDEPSQRYQHMVWLCHKPLLDVIISTTGQIVEDVETLQRLDIPASVWVPILQKVSLNAFMAFVEGSNEGYQPTATIMKSIFDASLLLFHLNELALDEGINLPVADNLIQQLITLLNLPFTSIGTPVSDLLMQQSALITSSLIRAFPQAEILLFKYALHRWYRELASTELVKRLRLV